MGGSEGLGGDSGGPGGGSGGPGRFDSRLSFLMNIFSSKGSGGVVAGITTRITPMLEL